MKKETKKNKVLVFSVLSLFAITLVAAIGYYAIFSATFTVNPAVITSGDLVFEGDYYGGQEISGGEITITNNAPSDRIINISDNSEGTGVNVSYVGTLELSQKNLDTWTLEGETKTINYTVVGETFVVSGIPDEYTLIYYPNLVSGWYAGISTDVTVLNNGVNTIGDLPDTSIDVGDDYCNNTYNPNATQCVGAKLWLILGDETIALAKLDNWSMADTLFETELIQYNSGGIITLSPRASLTITPIYDIGAYESGDYNITTTVA
ncbi:MAG TPA: hypothetical protein ENH46_00440 [Candidatus Pacearchaeota archaeon]|nr:hypothetical protein [Candidatus Pacearchaeota archaeon]